MVKSEDRTVRVFYIEKGEFLRSTMEFALKAKGADIYTIETLDNHFYLLDDLVPDLILFDVETAKDHLDQLRTYSKKAVLVALGTIEQEVLVADMIKTFLVKPIEARNLAQKILSLVD